MNHFSKWARAALLACATSLSLAGCGGGDDSPSPISDDKGNNQPPPAARFAAAGFWGGPLVYGQTQPYSGIQNTFWDIAPADGSHMGFVMLPSGETWGVSIVGGAITNAGHGQTQVAGASVTINYTSFSSMATGSSNGFTGSVVPKSQLNLVAAYVAVDSPYRTTFPTTYDARYDQPATLPNIAGAYVSSGSNGSGTFYGIPDVTPPLPAASRPMNSGLARPSSPAALSPLSKGNYTVTISSTGAVTLPPDPLGCSGSGAVMPRTDSNVYNLSIRFSGSKCVLGNGVAVKGIAVVENGHLLMLAIPPAGSSPAGEFAYISN